MADKKKAVNDGRLDASTQAQLSAQDITKINIINQGTFGEPRLEAVPQFIQTESERVISNKNNAWIVLGRDRPGNRMSGYGGRGDTQAGSIDLVVGRMSYKPDSKKHVDPNFIADSARIYISQKTDIDQNFNLADGTVGDVTTASGIGIKADQVRIVGREGIKLVTVTDAVNSQGGRVKGITGIDLIAGNNDAGLEPLVKGSKLISCLEKMAEYISDLTEVVNGLATNQLIINNALLLHTHPIVPLVGPALPSLDLPLSTMIPIMNIGARTIPSLAINKINIAAFKFNHFNPVGDDYINSKNNNTN